MAAPASTSTSIPMCVCAETDSSEQLVMKVQGFIRPVAHVGSGDPVRVLRLYTTNTLDEAYSIYC